MKYLKISNEIGKLGEEIAVKYLKSLGHNIIERNYLEKSGEIDIISKYNNKVYFSEVKSRVSGLKNISASNSSIFMGVHPMKLKRMHKTIELYLLKHVTHETNWQIDAIGVYLDRENKKAKVVRIENIC